MTSKQPTFDSFKAKALENLSIQAEYEALSTAFEMKRQIIAIRKQAGITQQQMAELLGTKKSNISRLESLNSVNSPRLATIED